MTHRSILGIAALAVTFGMASVLHPAVAEVRDSESVNAFDTADLDGDGVVTADEFRLFAIEEYFFADTNRDGVVSATDQHHWDQAPMEAADTDHSDSISMPEFLNSSRHDFVNIDQDNNDILTREEVEAYKARAQ